VTPKRLDDAELGAIEKGLCSKKYCTDCNQKRKLLGHVAFLTKTLRTVEDNALILEENSYESTVKRKRRR
jgi:hypothetical protein